MQPRHYRVERAEGVGGGELAQQRDVARELAAASRQRVEVVLGARGGHQLVQLHLRGGGGGRGREIHRVCLRN